MKSEMKLQKFARNIHYMNKLINVPIINVPIKNKKEDMIWS